MTLTATKNAKDFGKVAVLYGGLSSEREVSLKSGKAVYEGLRKRNVDAHLVDVGSTIVAQLQGGHFDRAFNILHGPGGEDGVMQGLLETLGIPYTGSGVQGSALAMDKLRTKFVWRGCGLPTPEFVILRGPEEFLEVARRLGFPVVVKPIHEGSSIGISKVDSADQLEQAWATARKYDREIIAERWITGGEYTASILNHEALPLIKLETPRAFYDYEAKYLLDNTRYLCPCGLSASLEKELREMALKAFDFLGLAGWGRIDFMLDRENGPWLIEANTTPGMTDHSLVPMAARAAGYSFDELVWRILETTLTEERV